MAETTTTKRGRKPNSTSAELKTAKNVENNTDMAEMLAEMQKQMLELKAELETAKKEKEEATNQNLDLQTLVDALKSSGGNGDNLPNYVTVISLIPNTYNISTEANGKGTVYTFEELGETKIISLNDMQKIMGVSTYRKQAENGYFYIVEDEVNNYFRIDQTATKIDEIREIISLKSDDAVDKFCSLEEKLRSSLADKMALDITEGKKLDRNKLGEILDRVGLDIEEKSKLLKKVVKQ